MFDTHSIARSLTDAHLTAEQADAITAAVASAADHGDQLGRADLQESVSVLRAEMAAMESRLTWRLVGAMTAISAIMRFIG